MVDDVATSPVISRRQILIVDDIEANLTALEVALEPLRRPLVKARSGREALAQLLARDFSLVLLDHQGDVERTKEAGFHAHLVKPASAAAIMAAISVSDGGAGGGLDGEQGGS